MPNDETMEDQNTEAQTEGTEGDEAQNEGASIVPAKYRDKYRGAGDWLKQFVDKNVTETVTREKKVTGEDGTESTETVTTKRTQLNLPRLFDLAEKNNIDVDKYKGDVEKKNAPGRLRMTIGNMLRAAARKRHGLFDLDGEWHDAPAEFLGDAERTHERDGTKIAKAAPAQTEGEAEGGEEEA